MKKKVKVGKRGKRKKKVGWIECVCVCEREREGGIKKVRTKGRK